VKRALLIALLLAGCTKPELFKDSDPTLTAPPWQAMIKAPPDAANDIDQETLTGQREDAVVEAPLDPVADAIPAAGDGTSIKVVAVLPVSGDPKGELRKAMRAQLEEAGWPVIDAPRQDALNIEGGVKISPAASGQQAVTVSWAVKAPNGKKLGDVNQSNTIPQGSLDKGWGDTAALVAQAAADGIFKLIDKFR
jgi:hypothetical protein